MFGEELEPPGNAGTLCTLAVRGMVLGLHVPRRARLELVGQVQRPKLPCLPGPQGELGSPQAPSGPLGGISYSPLGPQASPTSLHALPPSRVQNFGGRICPSPALSLTPCLSDFLQPGALWKGARAAKSPCPLWCQFVHR